MTYNSSEWPAAPLLNQIICGDALDVLEAMPDQSVNTIITSPPYFGLRSYLQDNDPNKHIEIGLEKTVDEYVTKLVVLFREARRVLRDDGVFWLNLGDSYASFRDGKVNANTIANGNTRSAPQSGAANRSADNFTGTGIKHKDLIGIPWRVALALQADGWILRSAAPYVKVSAMPESVQDRPSTAHEYVFQFVKSNTAQFWVHEDGKATRKRPKPDYKWVNVDTDEEVRTMPEGWQTDKGVHKQWRRVNMWEGHDYWFDADAVRVPSKTESHQRAMRAVSPHHKNLHIPGQTQHSLHKARAHGEGYDLPEARNRRTSDTFLEAIEAQIEELLYMRDVVNHKGAMVSGDTISAFYLGPEPNSVAHFATFPTKLIEPLVLCSCPHKVCSCCKAPYVRVTERSPMEIRRSSRASQMGRYGRTQASGTMTKPARYTSKGFVPTCTCDKGTESGVVYDPFVGSGTTPLVARKLGRQYSASELNPDYVDITNHALRLPFERVSVARDSEPLTDLPLFQRKDVLHVPSG